MAQIRPEALLESLRKPLQPVYVVYGDELLSLEAADQIRQAARTQGYEERLVLTALPNFDWGELTSATGNMSLFSLRKLVEMRIPTGKPGTEGAKALQRYCEHIPDDTCLLITLPDLGWKEEKAAWFTHLSSNAIVIKASAPHLQQMPQWINSRLQRNGQQAGQEALDFITERVEGNLLAAHQEIQKLALLYSKGPLSFEQVQQAILNVARYDIEDLRMALLDGDLARLIRIVEGLREENEAPPLVLWAITEEIRGLAQAQQRLQSGEPSSQVLRDLRIHAARAPGFRNALARLTLVRLHQAQQQLGRMDRLMKGVGDRWEGDFWQVVLRLMYRLCLRS